MPHNYESKFEIEPRKFVFVPTEDCLREGAEIVRKILYSWQPHEIFFHLGKRGGHVAAMRIHLENTYFAKIDLTQFFAKVTRTKIVRSLKRIGVCPKDAFDIAYASVVVHDGKKFLPYGFTQSMALVTVCVQFSALGSELISINDHGQVRVSMYVDDIIISSKCRQLLQSAYCNLLYAANQSNFEVNSTKCIAPSTEIQSFNCHISQGSIVIGDKRMDKFVIDFNSGNEGAQEAIMRYIKVVNENQLNQLLQQGSE